MFAVLNELKKTFFGKLNGKTAFQKLSWLHKIINRPCDSFHLDFGAHILHRF